MKTFVHTNLLFKYPQNLFYKSQKKGNNLGKWINQLWHIRKGTVIQQQNTGIHNDLDEQI